MFPHGEAWGLARAARLRVRVGVGWAIPHWGAASLGRTGAAMGHSPARLCPGALGDPQGWGFQAVTDASRWASAVYTQTGSPPVLAAPLYPIHSPPALGGEHGGRGTPHPRVNAHNTHTHAYTSRDGQQEPQLGRWLGGQWEPRLGFGKRVAGLVASQVDAAPVGAPPGPARGAVSTHQPLCWARAERPWGS